MRITLLVCEPVVNTVGSYPENGPAFETQRATEGQQILDPLGSSVAAMCEQPVIAHPDSQASRYPLESNCKEQSFPGKKEQCRNSPNMKGGHEKGCYPVDLAIASELLCSCVLILHNCTTARANRFDVRHQFWGIQSGLEGW